MKWIKAMLPEQILFYTEGYGHALDSEILTEPTIDFEFFLDEGFWAFVNGEFYEHVEESNWEQYAAELEENGVERVVLLDWYGAVLHETQPKLPEGVVEHNMHCWTVWLDTAEWFEISRISEIASCLYGQESNKLTMCLSRDSLEEEFESSDNAILQWILDYLKTHKDIWEVRLGVWS